MPTLRLCIRWVSGACPGTGQGWVQRGLRERRHSGKSGLGWEGEEDGKVGVGPSWGDRCYSTSSHSWRRTSNGVESCFLNLCVCHVESTYFPHGFGPLGCSGEGDGRPGAAWICFAVPSASPAWAVGGAVVQGGSLLPGPWTEVRTVCVGRVIQHGSVSLKIAFQTERQQAFYLGSKE